MKTVAAALNQTAATPSNVNSTATTMVARAAPRPPTTTRTAPTVMSAMASTQSPTPGPSATPVRAATDANIGSNASELRKTMYHQRLIPQRRPSAVSRPVWSADAGVRGCSVVIPALYSRPHRTVRDRCQRCRNRGGGEQGRDVVDDRVADQQPESKLGRVVGRQPHGQVLHERWEDLQRHPQSAGDRHREEDRVDDGRGRASAGDEPDGHAQQ